MDGTKYTITNKETGESIKVLTHTVGDGFIDFARADLAGTDEWMKPTDLYRFENPDGSGNLSSETWDIVKDENATDEA